VSADWDSAKARWTLRLEAEDGATSRLTCRFLFLGAGYYDYDAPHDPAFAGREAFRGRIVHPQFWPDDLDLAGKQVVVIGSGATAATLVPALARTAAHVTMLQRTPSWYFARPAEDAIAKALGRVLPERWAYALTRIKNVLIQDIAFRRARSEPAKIGGFLKRQAQKLVGERFEAEAFSPPYDPWRQRLCLLPDGDLFAALREGRASIITDEIERFVDDGLALKSGRHLAADVIVTATGLKLAIAGKIAVRVDGVPVRWNKRFYYRSCMFSGVPNFAALMGYINAAWTLRVDLVGRYICRVLRRMDALGAQVVTPVLPAGLTLEEDDVLDFTSGYIERSRRGLPKSASTLPWRLSQDYRFDRKDMRRARLDDGFLQFARIGEPADEGRERAGEEAAACLAQPELSPNAAS
jgi:cation diffusion facilitator CzcD-associated flavoprotein CzcO